MRGAECKRRRRQSLLVEAAQTELVLLLPLVELAQAWCGRGPGGGRTEGASGRGGRGAAVVAVCNVFPPLAVASYGATLSHCMHNDDCSKNALAIAKSYILPCNCRQCTAECSVNYCTAAGLDRSGQ